MPNNLPLVSVIIPSYNHAEYITESIQSIIDQDYENIELVIIDDGSKDNSIEVISKMIPVCEQRFVRFEFRSRPNRGLCATLNEGLEWCTGQYLSAIASDDIARKHKIQYLVDKIIESHATAVFGNIHHIGSSNIVSTINRKTEHSFEDLFLQKNIPAAPASLINLEALKEAGGYPENIKIEDWYMWLKLTYTGKRLISYPEIVNYYRRHAANTVNDRELMYRSRKEIINLYSEHKLYRKALQKNTLIRANEKASTLYIEPLIMLIEAKSYSKESLKVLVKSLMPKQLIQLKRAIL